MAINPANIVNFFEERHMNDGCRPSLLVAEGYEVAEFNSNTMTREVMNILIDSYAENEPITRFLRLVRSDWEKLFAHVLASSSHVFLARSTSSKEIIGVAVGREDNASTLSTLFGSIGLFPWSILNFILQSLSPSTDYVEHDSSSYDFWFCSVLPSWSKKSVCHELTQALLRDAHRRGFRFLRCYSFDEAQSSMFHQLAFRKVVSRRYSDIQLNDVKLFATDLGDGKIEIWEGDIATSTKTSADAKNLNGTQIGANSSESVIDWEEGFIHP